MIAILIALLIGLMNVLYFLVIVRGSTLKRGQIKEGQSPDVIQIRGVRLNTEKFSAGILIYFMGAVSLISWAYFMYTGFHSFLARPGQLLPHVLMQLGVSLYLLIAAHAVLRAWPRHTTLFFTSLGATALVSLISLFTHGQDLHLMSMHVFSTFVQMVGSVLAAAVYVAGMIFVEEPETSLRP